MLPGGIEDAKSSNDHLKVESSLRCETGNIKQATPVLTHERASKTQLANGGMVKPVSDASVVALRCWLTRIDMAITNLDDCIFIAENSTAIEHVSREVQCTEI